MYCNYCKKEKNENEFTKENKSKCKECLRLYKLNRYKNDPHAKKLQLNSVKKYKRRNWIKCQLQCMKARAKKLNIDFDLTEDDIIIPEYCPVSGIKFETEPGKNRENRPSIDRIINTKGYTKDNIVIVSNKVNRIKSNVDLKLLENMYNFYKNLDYTKNIW